MTPTSRVTTQFDIPEMLDAYAHHPNYEIVELNKDDDHCIIYFSSNGLYAPNDSETFRRVIIENNRFEWKRNTLQSANKAIFLRDVTKQWYWEGINASISTIEKLAAFLEEQTRDLRVICVGNSSGGYAATLFGCLLNASHVFNLSGQFSLGSFLDTESGRALNPTLAKRRDNPAFDKYFSIVEILKRSRTPIFYLYPAKSETDIYQSKLVDGIDSVFAFKFDSDSHGTTCDRADLPDLTAMSIEQLILLHEHFKNSLIRQFAFSVKTSGFVKSWRRRIEGRLGIKRKRAAILPALRVRSVQAHRSSSSVPTRIETSVARQSVNGTL